MGDWLTYTLSDLLLFSERVYWRLFALENAALWPLPLLAPLAMLAALAVHARRPDIGFRLLCGLFALAWLSVGWNFILHRYAPVNWAMSYVAPVFALQAVAFVLLMLHGGTNVTIPGSARIVGYGLILAGTLAYPGLAIVQGRAIESAEMFAIAPDPTALASLGAAFLVSGRWYRLAAFAVPCAWLAQSAVTLYALNGPAALAPALGLGIGIGGLAILGNRPWTSMTRARDE